MYEGCSKSSGPRQKTFFFLFNDLHLFLDVFFLKLYTLSPAMFQRSYAIFEVWEKIVFTGG